MKKVAKEIRKGFFKISSKLELDEKIAIGGLGFVVGYVMYQVLRWLIA